MLSEQDSAERVRVGLLNQLEVRGELDAARAETILHLADGRSVTIPTASLLGVAGRAFVPAASFEEGQEIASREQVIPLLAEQMEVGKKTAATGAVRLHRGTETFTDSVGIDLTRTGWEVERVAVGELLAERPEVREEGDVTIFPLVEERLVARREYFLREEVRVRRVATTTPRTVSLELKRDVLSVEREEFGPVAGEDAGPGTLGQGGGVRSA